MNKTNILTLLMLCVVSISCIKEQLETTYNKQEDQIDQYISNNTVVTNELGETDTLRVVRNNGSNRLVLKEGTGDKLDAGGIAYGYARE